MSAQVFRVTSDRLEIAYFDRGPRDGSPVLLLHGWPDDPYTWFEVAGALTTQGWRAIIPYLRGFGATRFRSPDIMRSGDLEALARDAIDLADGLGLDQVAVIGHDWGARAAYIAACALPQRITHCVALAVGWGTNAPDQQLSLDQIQNYWYHWYFALERGAQLVRERRRALVERMWRQWSVLRQPDQERLAGLHTAFASDDWAEVVIHSYRVRWGLAHTDPAYDDLRHAVAADPIISVPTLVIHGEADPCNDPTTSEAKDQYFAGTYRRVTLPGVGHFPQWEAPADTSRLILDFLSTTT